MLLRTRITSSRLSAPPSLVSRLSSVVFRSRSLALLSTSIDFSCLMHNNLVNTCTFVLVSVVCTCPCSPRTRLRNTLAVVLCLVRSFALFISLRFRNPGSSLSQGATGLLSMVEATSPSVLQFLGAVNVPLLDEKAYAHHSFLCEHLRTPRVSALLCSLSHATLALRCSTQLCSLRSSTSIPAIAPAQLALYSHALTLPETSFHLSVQFYLPS